MKKSIVSVFTPYPVFVGTMDEVRDAAWRSDNADGQIALWREGYALVVGIGFGVIGVFAERGHLFDALRAARVEQSLIAQGATW